MKIQLSINKLEHLIKLAKAAKLKDESLSSTLQIELISDSDTHLGDDHIGVTVKSGYAECNGTLIYAHWLPVTN